MKLKAAKKTNLPFGVRMKAWWDGYDSGEVARRLAERQHAPEPEPEDDPFKKPEPAPEPEPAPVAEVPLVRKAMPWDQKRVEIAELVWGEGYCGPGGPENVIAMSKLLTLSPEMSMLVIGAELGGPARTLAQNFGVWISAYEGDEDLAKAGMDISERKGMAKKAPVVFYDYEAAKPFERRFDRAMAKESLHHVPDIAAVIKRVEESLKDDGLFLITNYVLADESAAFDSDVRRWMEHEPTKVYMQTPQELVEILSECGFGIRVNEDRTDHYQALVRQTWKNAGDFIKALLEKGDEGKPMIDILLREAELWTERGKLFDSGKLRVWRMLAHKKELGTLMSDW